MEIFILMLSIAFWGSALVLAAYGRRELRAAIREGEKQRMRYAEFDRKVEELKRCTR